MHSIKNIGYHFSEYRLSLKYDQSNTKGKNIQTIIITMRDQVLKNIFIFRTNMPKNNFFHTFKTRVGTLSWLLVYSANGYVISNVNILIMIFRNIFF